MCLYLLAIVLGAVGCFGNQRCFNKRQAESLVPEGTGSGPATARRTWRIRSRGTRVRAQLRASRSGAAGCPFYAAAALTALYVFCLFFAFLIFQLQCTFNIPLYWFQVYRTVVRPSPIYTVSPDISSTRLAPTVIAILLTRFPVLHSASPWTLCNYPPALLKPFTVFTHPTSPRRPAATRPLSVCKSAFIVFVSLLGSLDSPYE